ncbi:hypothetical protein Pla108_15020 [Botrimarina colliarenosi]|uniref:Leucine Rich repeats (2 copies) n=1 Tax=Botrimarina colliarenosi TaxID=2528001 RepID=A0A5C6ALN6_9BACT|nr:hypothetical protein [Botrimarina colliarenosi]TWU00550.1 hypothetical protein Pla108_15020 [Botrimarina colliarenosi]
MRRWLLPRFRLRSLLVLTAVISVVLAGWEALVRPYRDQAAAVAQLRKEGATVGLERATLSGWRRDVVRWVVGPEALVEAISVELCDVALPEDFSERISSLPFLVDVKLDRTDLDDSDAKALAKKSRLRRLSIRYTRVTDAGIAGSVSQLPALEELRLTGLSGVTDAGLATIAELPALREVYLRWTGATTDGIEAFRASVPGRVVHTQLGG